MDEKYYAHLSEDGRKHLELAHLEGTAEICASFAAKFGKEALGRFYGITSRHREVRQGVPEATSLRWEKGGPIHVGRALPRVLDPGLHSVLL